DRKINHYSQMSAAPCSLGTLLKFLFSCPSFSCHFGRWNGRRFRRQLLDDKRINRRSHQEQFVESFGQGWALEAFECRENRGPGNSSFAGAGVVLFEGCGNVRLKEIANDPKTGLSGRFDVVSAISNSCVRIVDHKALLRFDAELQQSSF